MSLTCLPYEVVSIILEGLELEDTFHLGLSCRRLLYLIQDNRSCKGILEVSFLARYVSTLLKLHNTAFSPSLSFSLSLSLHRKIKTIPATQAVTEYTSIIS